MNVLHILPYVPDIKSGAHVRDHNLIKYLSKEGVTSQVICNVDESDELNNITSLERELNTKIYITKAPKQSSLKKMEIVLFYHMFPPIHRYNTSTHKGTISSILKKNSFDIIHAQHIIEAAPTIEAISDVSFKGCKIITLHNVDHLLFMKEINLQKNPLMKFAYKRAASGLKEHELNILSKFDHIFVVSEVDKSIYISKGIPKNKIDVIPNGVDCNIFNPEKIADKNALAHPNILFMGKLDYIPNKIAIKIYLHQIHQIIRKEVPEIKFYIIGKNYPEWLKEYSKIDSSVEIIGFVEDVRPYIQSADVCISPLTMGSGTRLKILEYLAMGKPVVSSTIGAEGLEVEDNKNILIADEWDEFANKIIALLNNNHLAKKIGANGRKLVEEKYNWKNVVEKQIRVYEKLLKS